MKKYISLNKLTITETLKTWLIALICYLSTNYLPLADSFKETDSLEKNSK